MQLKSFLCCIALLWASLLFAQQERINALDVQLQVNTDRSISITETYQVYAAGDKIKRGLTRQLPGKRDMKGKSRQIEYDILEVTRDGEKENYHIQSVGDDKMMYLGNKEVFLEPGEYTYRIKYKAEDQVGLFEDYDEIYWNIVGSGVQFPVGQVSARVILPKGVIIQQDSAYVGQFGATVNDYRKEVTGNNIVYQTTRPLQPGEAFTVAVGFSKGAVDPPSLLDQFGALLTILLSALILLPYYFFTWWKHGQDPPKPAAYPGWEPPDGLSAASLSYILKEGSQKQNFTASVVSLAVKGYLRIEQEEVKNWFSKKRIYELVKLKPADEHLPLEEQDVMQTLFAADDTVVIDGEYHEYMKDAFTEHEASIKAQHQHFVREGYNKKFLIFPIILTIASVFVTMIIFANSPNFAQINVWAFGTFVPVAIGLIILYNYLINKPTEEKLDLQSRIEGFKLYLEMAEKDRLQLLNPPDRTPDHFEALLPFAFALGVEHQWTENFKDVLDKANYEPQWSSTNPVLYMGDFGRDFTRTASSSGVQPSQDGSGGGWSGSGGGGFAGGGGGGGGVGGW